MTPLELRDQLIQILGGLIGIYSVKGGRTYQAIWISPPIVDPSYVVSGLQVLVYKAPEVQKIIPLTGDKLKRIWWTVDLIQYDTTQSVRPALEAIENFYPVTVSRTTPQTRTDYEQARITIYDPQFTGVSGVIKNQFVSESALSASSFIDSFGVNTHLRYLDTTYANYDSIIKPRLTEIGIKHIRDTVVLTDAIAISRVNDLHTSNGIKSTLMFDPRNISVSDVPAAIATVSSAVESIESANEWDLAGDATYKGQTFPAGLLLWHQDLHDTLQTAYPGLPLLAPSMAYAAAGSKIGSVASDYGNMHSYSYDGYPAGGGLSDQILAAQLISPGKQVISTETGWQNSTNPYHLSEVAAAKYATRVFPLYFSKGIKRTYLYEFIDERNDSSDGESCFGMLKYDGTPKQSFTAIKNMIAILGDSGSTTIKSVSFSLSSASSNVSSNVNHIILQKISGRIYFLIWNEVSSYNISSSSDITNTDVLANLTLGSVFSTANTYLPLVSSSIQSSQIQPTSLSLSVPDHLLIVELIP